ncbi:MULTISPECIES: DUF3307 domain-containing protein [unclassified Sulfitobacter]|uniref:membrane protein n=1 Tax=Sulfitobacter phage pCB2047-C TaxID=754043 RepID=UPI0002C05904|nr:MULTISPECIES: DUF3307 domain-containing protein [unclassified Sulfitobacter]YP_007675320.1 membrane protein [Sulfitobacter phage pCB2047-C]YP_007675411.1 membrane protein [Sulfitobacter phage pCB2047-A]YP_009146211.1 membrane protein [Sulfitobacter phage NYA-2014a]AGG91233.1 hypothetical protein SUBG_00063 [Sulfitobacter phage pCB2047-C]AGH30745.1 hypothetical protein SUAG_00019 [Sulfitobacter phage pCB2047-A]AIM40668.1 DUF3307-containing protein [Sulfitobacter phage NYA-2014a]PTA99592.1 
MNLFEVFALLVAGHALCDYPLQGEFLANGKNHRAPIPGAPWYQLLAAHSAIHAGAVFLITGSLTLALLEFAAHTAIDYTKCDGKIGFNADQALHILCKVIWVAALALGVAA